MEYKAYSFDLDDNLLKLPTEISLKQPTGKILKISTLEFEKIRSSLKKLNLEIIPKSFEDFRSDEQFLIDINKSKKAGSWKNLENCIIQHTSIFAIITARGHTPKALKEGLKLAIIKNISKSQLQKFTQKFTTKYKIKSENLTQEEILDKYLNLCKFYPLNNPETIKKFKTKDLGELKALAFEDFQNYIKKHVRENFGKKIKVKIGFSDDSIFHLKKIISSILKKHGIFFYQTSDKGKTSFI